MQTEIHVRPLTRFLKFFFRHFYHGFAWTYDFVAAFVSIGRWNEWISCALPYIQGSRVLEIGHGPGHLQISLRQDGTRWVAGLDESPHMGRLTRNRLQRGNYANINLARGVAQSLPFRNGAFETVVSTFPAEYIFEAQTMSEVRRVLDDGGRFIVVPAAWIVGRKVLDKSAAWIFQVTSQAPPFPASVMAERLLVVFQAAGFKPEFATVKVRSSEVLVVIAHI